MRLRERKTMQAALLPLLLLGAVPAPAPAQVPDAAVYQCTKPNAPLLYTDGPGLRQARAQGHECKSVPALPVTVPQPGRAPVAATAPRREAASAPVPVSAGERVAPQQQRERDNDARAILEAELQREQARLRQLLAEYNDGQPERQGNERNHQRYLDRVAALKASIERCSADIAALQRELTRVSRP